MPSGNKKLTREEKRERARYLAMVNERMPRSKTLMQCIIAFAVGGAICCIGQLVGDLGSIMFSLDEKTRGAFISVVMIFLGSFATGLGVYDRLGAFAGAGAAVSGGTSEVAGSIGAVAGFSGSPFTG